MMKLRARQLVRRRLCGRVTTAGALADVDCQATLIHLTTKAQALFQAVSTGLNTVKYRNSRARREGRCGRAAAMHNRTTILPQQGGDQCADGELYTEKHTIGNKAHLESTTSPLVYGYTTVVKPSRVCCVPLFCDILTTSLSNTKKYILTARHPFFHNHVDNANTGSNATTTSSNLPWVVLFPSHA